MRRERRIDLRVHASDLADVLEEDSGGAQHQDGHLRTGGRWGERRGEEEEEGAEEQCLRERGGVYEGGDEEGQREGGRDAAGDGGEGPDGGHHGVPAAVPSPPAAMLLACVFWSGGRGDLQAGAVG